MHRLQPRPAEAGEGHDLAQVAGHDRGHHPAIGRGPFGDIPVDRLAGIGAPECPQQMQLVEPISQALALGDDGDALAGVGQGLWLRKAGLGSHGAGKLSGLPRLCIA